MCKSVQMHPDNTFHQLAVGFALRWETSTKAVPWKLADTSTSAPTSSSPSPDYPHSSPAPSAALVLPTIPPKAATSLRHAGRLMLQNHTTWLPKPSCEVFPNTAGFGMPAKAEWNHSITRTLNWYCFQIAILLGWPFKHFWSSLHSLNRKRAAPTPELPFNPSTTLKPKLSHWCV